MCRLVAGTSQPCTNSSVHAHPERRLGCPATPIGRGAGRSSASGEAIRRRFSRLWRLKAAAQPDPPARSASLAAAGARAPPPHCTGHRRGADGSAFLISDRNQLRLTENTSHVWRWPLAGVLVARNTDGFGRSRADPGDGVLSSLVLETALRSPPSHSSGAASPMALLRPGSLRYTCGHTGHCSSAVHGLGAPLVAGAGRTGRDGEGSRAIDGERVRVGGGARRRGARAGPRGACGAGRRQSVEGSAPCKFSNIPSVPGRSRLRCCRKSGQRPFSL